jgi:hypothetical protein
MNKSISSVIIIFRYRWVRVTVILLVFLILVLRGIIGLGKWLVTADTVPLHLDLICTFAGDRQRVDYSKELMQQHPLAHWVMSDYKNGYGRLLQKDEFDMHRVSIIDTCKNTLSEVLAFRKWIDSVYTLKCAVKQDKDGSILHVGLISSPYHMRRIRMMANRHLKKKNVQFYCIFVPFNSYNWDDTTFRYWWRSDQIASYVYSEIAKIAYFILTGYL